VTPSAAGFCLFLVEAKHLPGPIIIVCRGQNVSLSVGHRMAGPFSSSTISAAGRKRGVS